LSTGRVNPLEVLGVTTWMLKDEAVLAINMVIQIVLLGQFYLESSKKPRIFFRGRWPGVNKVPKRWSKVFFLFLQAAVASSIAFAYSSFWRKSYRDYGYLL
jgi:hypothetical protein